jgi:hypothetical protein
MREAPAAADELTVPTQKRRRLDQQRTHPRQSLAEHRQQDAVGGPNLRPGDLAAQHLQLMAQKQISTSFRCSERASSSSNSNRWRASQ